MPNGAVPRAESGPSLCVLCADPSPFLSLCSVLPGLFPVLRSCHEVFGNKGPIKLVKTIMLHERGGKMPAQSLSFLSVLSSCGLCGFISGFVFLWLLRRSHNLAGEPQDGAVASETKICNLRDGLEVTVAELSRCGRF